MQAEGDHQIGVRIGNQVSTEVRPQLFATGDRVRVFARDRDGLNDLIRFIDKQINAGLLARTRVLVTEDAKETRFLMHRSDDAVVSALSIHHLPDARKRTIFGEIRERLKPNGWYINYDPVRAPDANIESVWERVNDVYDPDGPYKRANRSPLEQARYENHVRYMIPLGPQLEWLRTAGFTNVDVFWKRLDWVIYGGSNPG